MDLLVSDYRCPWISIILKSQMSCCRLKDGKKAMRILIDLGDLGQLFNINAARITVLCLTENVRRIQSSDHHPHTQARGILGKIIFCYCVDPTIFSSTGLLTYYPKCITKSSCISQSIGIMAEAKLNRCMVRIFFSLSKI